MPASGAGSETGRRPGLRSPWRGLQEWIDAGEEVVVVFRVKATGRASGVELERQDAIVCRVKDAEIARIDYYNSRGQALEAVGLEE
jgi:ketosteroid isomerase-like protein